jgi:hypothetical protein
MVHYLYYASRGKACRAHEADADGGRRLVYRKTGAFKMRFSQAVLAGENNGRHRIHTKRVEIEEACG